MVIMMNVIDFYWLEIKQWKNKFKCHLFFTGGWVDLVETLGLFNIPLYLSIYIFIIDDSAMEVNTHTNTTVTVILVATVKT